MARSDRDIRRCYGCGCWKVIPQLMPWGYCQRCREDGYLKRNHEGGLGEGESVKLVTTITVEHIVHKDDFPSHLTEGEIADEVQKRLGRLAHLQYFLGQWPDETIICTEEDPNRHD